MVMTVGGRARRTLGLMPERRQKRRRTIIQAVVGGNAGAVVRRRVRSWSSQNMSQAMCTSDLTRREMVTPRLVVLAFARIVPWYYLLSVVCRTYMPSNSPLFMSVLPLVLVHPFVYSFIQVPRRPRCGAAHLPHGGPRCHRRRLGVYIIPRAAGHAG